MLKITYIGAHIDDAELWAGGTLLNYKDNGHQVNVIIRDTQDKLRKKEQEESSIVSGFDVSYYKTVGLLRDRLTAVIPDILITHWDEDSHPDHRQTSLDVLRAVKQCWIKHKKPTQFFFCDTYNKLGLYGEFSPTKYVDVSSVIERKRSMIMPFKSQGPEFYIEKVEMLTRLYGSRCRCEHAEGFKQFNYLGTSFSSELL